MNEKDKAVFETYKMQGFYCLDGLPEDAEIGGIRDGDVFKDLAVIFAPCNVDGTAEPGAHYQPGCIADLEA